MFIDIQTYVNLHNHTRIIMCAMSYSWNSFDQNKMQHYHHVQIRIQVGVCTYTLYPRSLWIPKYNVKIDRNPKHNGSGFIEWKDVSAGFCHVLLPIKRCHYNINRNVDKPWTYNNAHRKTIEH